MNSLRALVLPRWCWGLLVFLVLVWLLPGKAAGPPAAERPAAKVELRVFPLRHIAVGDALQILRDLLGDPTILFGDLTRPESNPGGRRPHRPFGDARISGDEKANSLIVRAERAKIDEVAAIVRAIDTERPSNEKPPLQFWTLYLNNVEPDQALDEALRLAFGNRGKFVVDRRRRLVFATADEATIATVRKLLVTLDIAASATKPTDVLAGLRVTVFWLVSGPGRSKPAGLPDELRGLAAELNELGMKPRLAARVVTTTTPDFHFENTSTVHLAGSWNLSVAGTAAMKKNKVELNLTIGVKQGSRQSSSLRTQVSVAPNRPVLLGVTPTETLTSAFVVSITGAKAAGPMEKKAGIVKPSDRDNTALLDELYDLTARIQKDLTDIRIKSVQVDLVPQMPKSKFVAKLTLKGELRTSRRALDRLVAQFSKESRCSLEAPRVDGKQFTLVVCVRGLP